MNFFYLGQIFMGGWNFAPRGAAFCDGQLMSIAQHTAVFSLYGTNYGGDGRSTFGLPDLRGRFPMHQGNAPGRSNRRLGSVGGHETHSLLVPQLPPHGHPTSGGLTIGATKGTSTEVKDNYLGNSLQGDNPFYRTAADTDSEKTKGGEGIVVGNTGNSEPFNIMNPFQVISFCVSMVGIFPSRH